MENSHQNNKRKAVRVEVDGVSKRYGDLEVLKDVSFTVEPGEIFVIMGPSGSGKSVLLKSIIGLECPSYGQVLIDGNDASFRRTHSIIITSMVFQAGALFNSMSVYDNLALYPREHALYDHETIDRKVRRILEMLSLDNAAQKSPSELSGGMRKRVAIARSLMMEPQLLLYDEPTSELDPIMAANIIEVIATLKEEYDVTSIVVSHDRDLAFSIGERVAVLIDGVIRLIAPGKQIGKECKDPVVKDFFNPIIDIKNPRFKRNNHTSS